MKKYNKAIYVLILVLFCCGIMMGSYKNEKSIVYNRKEKIFLIFN